MPNGSCRSATTNGASVNQRQPASWRYADALASRYGIARPLSSSSVHIGPTTFSKDSQEASYCGNFLASDFKCVVLGLGCLTTVLYSWSHGGSMCMSRGRTVVLQHVTCGLRTDRGPTACCMWSENGPWSHCVLHVY